MTSTVDKETLKSEVLQSRNNALRQVKVYCDEQDRIEAGYKKYFAELKKHSPDFVLTKTKKTDTHGVYAGQRGNRFKIDEIKYSYNLCKINFVGKFPEGCDKNIVITVEDHKVSSRNGWSNTNHGLKMKYTYDWNDSKYFKNAKTVVAKITEIFEDTWNSYNRVVDQQNKKNTAWKEAQNVFGGRLNATLTLRGTNIEVKHNNGVVVTLSYSVNEKNEVKFYIVKTEITKNSSDVVNFVESLGKL